MKMVFQTGATCDNKGITAKNRQKTFCISVRNDFSKTWQLVSSTQLDIC